MLQTDGAKGAKKAQKVRARHQNQKEGAKSAKKAKDVPAGQQNRTSVGTPSECLKDERIKELEEHIMRAENSGDGIKQILLTCTQAWAGGTPRAGATPQNLKVFDRFVELSGDAEQQAAAQRVYNLLAGERCNRKQEHLDLDFRTFWNEVRSLVPQNDGSARFVDFGCGSGLLLFCMRLFCPWIAIVVGFEPKKSVVELGRWEDMRKNLPEFLIRCGFYIKAPAGLSREADLALWTLWLRMHDLFSKTKFQFHEPKDAEGDLDKEAARQLAQLKFLTAGARIGEAVERTYVYTWWCCWKAEHMINFVDAMAPDISREAVILQIVGEPVNEVVTELKAIGQGYDRYCNLAELLYENLVMYRDVNSHDIKAANNNVYMYGGIGDPPGRQRDCKIITHKERPSLEGNVAHPP